ncbi:MAG: hypothetical protein GQ474_01615 [Sulfurimonas sp.]|nr:hypothetical protein [Sulfurimonas sp.]
MSDFKNIGDIPLAVGTQEKEVFTQTADIKHIFEYANIPKRYKGAKFEAQNESQQKLVDSIRANTSNKNIVDVSDMLIMGTVGTGKTHIAVGALNKLMGAGIYCRYATEHELLEIYFRKDYSKFDGFKKAKFLVIDELGKRELVDWQRIQIEELISYRYNEMLPTIFISNLNVSEFKKFVGDRVSDRMRDNSVIRITLDGSSLRGQKQNNKEGNK